MLSTVHRSICSCCYMKRLRNLSTLISMHVNVDVDSAVANIEMSVTHAQVKYAPTLKKSRPVAGTCLTLYVRYVIWCKFDM